jgi:hypothetical protein
VLFLLLGSESPYLEVFLSMTSQGKASKPCSGFLLEIPDAGFVLQTSAASAFHSNNKTVLF